MTTPEKETTSLPSNYGEEEDEDEFTEDKEESKEEDYDINEAVASCKDAFDVIALFSPYSKKRYKMHRAILIKENERKQQFGGEVKLQKKKKTKLYITERKIKDLSKNADLQRELLYTLVENKKKQSYNSISEPIAYVLYFVLRNSIA